jgi:predicted MFS family arabinose efflux permease
LLPDHLGTPFRWIWSASTVGNLGDGVLLAAGPLLVASITTDPFAVAMAFLVQRLPWFVFGLIAGALVDRVDRTSLIIYVDLVRVLVLGTLAALVALDLATLAIIYVALFLIGTSETMADNAGSALVADVVPKAGLGQANARLIGSMIVANQLAGPPLGAFIFGLGAAYPLGFNAICFVVAIVLIARIRSENDAAPARQVRSVRHEVIDGLKWLWSNPPVRTLAIMITAFNVTFGAAFSIWVLYSYERLGLDEFGFGLLMAASAIGGVGGSISFGWLEKRFSYATLLRIGLIIETFTHLGLALTISPVIAGAIMVTFGAHAIIWGTTATTVRQRVVPSSLLGRVTSVYYIGGFGALALGALIGGAIAQRWGVITPFWFAFAGSAVILLFTWRSIRYIAQEADASDQPSPTGPSDPRLATPLPEPD